MVLFLAAEDGEGGIWNFLPISLLCTKEEAIPALPSHSIPRTEVFKML